MPIRCYAMYRDLAQDKASNALWGLTVITVHDKIRCKCRCLWLKALFATARSRPPRAGPCLPALRRRPAGRGRSLLPRLPPGPCPVALQRALIHLRHTRLPLSSAGLTALQSGPTAPLPPPRVWMKPRMGGCVSPGGAHAAGPSPRPLAQVVLYSICLIVCRVTLLASQFTLRCCKLQTSSAGQYMMGLANPSFCAKNVPATNLRALQLHQAHSRAHQPEVPVITVQSCLS